MDIENIKRIVDICNKDISDLTDIEGAKEVLDILYKNKIIKLDKSGKIVKVEKEKLYVGRLQKKEGFGFVLVEGEDDFFVNNVDKFMDGDEVLIIRTRLKGKNQTAKILDYINRGNDYIILKKEKGNSFSYVGKDLGLKVVVNGLDYEQIKPGTILSVNVKEVKSNKIITVLNNIIADENDPDLDMKIILDKYNISVQFSSETEEELKKLEDEISKEEIAGRVDLRDQIFFTIDGNDSKDLDDAVSLVKNNDSYTLYVAIADVSHYVKPRTSLDDDASDRATSVYFIDRVVPMLPKKISNGICSLHAGVDRLTMTCEMEIDFKGRVKDIKVYKSVINSLYRMTYNDVNDMLIRSDELLISKYSDIYSILKEMNKLAKVLNKNRIRRGSFNLEDTEAKFILDDEQNIVKINPVTREDGEKLIEEFMILANESVTVFANKKNSPFIYRVHGQPNPNKLKEFKNFLMYLNVNTNIDYNDINPNDFKEVLDKIEDKVFKRVVSKMIVRSMQKAIYSTDNIGHFGLASEHYTHFTSPIRRYPDLEVHRILKKIIEPESEIESISKTQIENIAKHSSEKEVSAMKAEQEIEDRKKAEFMQKRIGEVLQGTITAIEEYGMFVELDNTIRGLVRFRDLENYKGNNLYSVEFFGEAGLKIGDKLEVMVTGVNVDRGLVDFLPKDYEKAKKTKKENKDSKKGTNKRNYKREEGSSRKPKNNDNRRRSSSKDKKNKKNKYSNNENRGNRNGNKKNKKRR